MNDFQHHLDLLALLRQALDHLRPRLNLPGQRFDQPANLTGGTGVFIGCLLDIDHLTQGCLHRMAFRLRLVGHLLQRFEAGRHFVPLQFGRRIGTGVTLAHDTDFLPGALRHFARLADDRLQLVDEAVDRRRHITNLVIAVQLDALGQIALARRQVIECSDQQMQLADNPTSEHHRQ